MKIILEHVSQSSETLSPSTRPRASRVWTAPLCALAVAVLFTGCGFLKPAKTADRHFVLSPLPPNPSATVPSRSIAVGLGRVKLPAYLFNTLLAVRKDTHEIEYLPSAFWAERLDAGFQRVLSANLAILIPTDRVILSAWQTSEVTVEIQVTLEQFDVDATGKAILVAHWRILSPGGENLLKAGTSRLSREGPPADRSVSQAIATLSDLVADFSRTLAETLKELNPA